MGSMGTPPFGGGAGPSLGVTGTETGIELNSYVATLISLDSYVPDVYEGDIELDSYVQTVISLDSLVVPDIN